MKMVKWIGTVLLAMLIGVFMPLLVWVALFVSFRQMFAEWRIIRARLLSGDVICSINNDCPSGYQCIGGRCLPMHS